MATKITVIGVGALGSHFVLFSRNFEASFKIIDFDRVEQKNVLAQFHSKTNVGQLKVNSLEKGMNFFFGKKLNSVPHKLVEANAQQLLTDSNLIVDCLDNGESRRLVQTFVRSHSIPCLHGAVSADGSYGIVSWDEHFAIDNEPSTGQATCENGDHLPFLATVSASLARSAQIFLSSGKKVGYRISPGGILVV